MVLMPLEPFVSTFNFNTHFIRLLFNASRAIYVCAIPVGQAVTANTYGSLDCLDDCSAVATCCASASASSSLSLHHQPHQ